MQAAAREAIDARLAERIGPTGMLKLRQMLALLVGIGHEDRLAAEQDAP